ncbi:hypothetical protein Hanom_Chr00s158615g01824481 [Helianthus anomalus]
MGQVYPKPDGYEISFKKYRLYETSMRLGDTRPDYSKLNIRLPELYTRKLFIYIYIFF